MEDAPDSCAIGPDERVSLTDPRLRECRLLPGTAFVIRYDTGSGGQRMRPVKAAAASAAEFVGPPAPEAVAPVATVAVPTTASGELSQLLPAGVAGSGLSLVLALVAVLGGGAAWRYYRQRSREQHELAMRELELRAAGPGQSAECKADGVAWRAEAQRLESRLVQLEGRAESLTIGGGSDDLEARIKKLERAGKAAAPTARKGKRKS